MSDYLYQLRHSIYMKLLPVILKFKYSIYPGNPIPEWDFLTFAAVNYMKALMNVNLQTSGNYIRDSFSMGRIYKKEGITVEKVDIPFEYRLKAQKIIRDKLLEDLNWDPCEPLDENSVEPLYGEWHIPDTESKTDHRAIFFAHGGAYMFSSVTSHRSITFKLAAESNVRCFSVEYRLAPENPFPAQLEDTLAAYLYLTEQSDSAAQNWDGSNMVFAGDSAGGGIIMGLLLLMRDLQIGSLPLGTILLSPYIDLAHKSPSFIENKDTDYVPYEFWDDSPQHEYCLRRFCKIVPKSAHHIKKNRHFLTNVKYLNYYLVSPLYSQDLKGLPPFFIQAGGREMLRDENILFAQKIHTQFEHKSFTNHLPPVTLQLYENMPHDFQLFSFLPASSLSLIRSANFVKRCFEIEDETPLDISFGPSTFNPKTPFQFIKLDGSTVDKSFIDVYGLKNHL